MNTDPLFQKLVDVAKLDAFIASITEEGVVISLQRGPGHHTVITWKELHSATPSERERRVDLAVERVRNMHTKHCLQKHELRKEKRRCGY